MPQVAVVTTFFPNPADPHRAVFVRNLVGELRALLPLHVVAPVPWRPVPGRWRAQAGVPRRHEADGLVVEHPRYLSLPGLFALSGLTYALGIWRTLRRLRDRHPGLLLHAHCGYPDAVGVALVARLLGLRYVVTVHGSDLNAHARRPLLRRQIAWALAGAREVVAVSAGLAQLADTLAGGRVPVRRIPCAAVDPTVFQPRDRALARAALSLPADTRRLVLFVGKLLPVKDPVTLARAWRLLVADGRVGPRDLLVFVGAGPEADRVREALGDTGAAASVRMAGALAQGEIGRWLAAANVLCLPSRSEGTPNVVVEALACGVPVVASRVGGVPDLVVDGVAGRLVPAGDAAALADALAQVCGREWDPDTVRRPVSGLTWGALAARNAELLRAAAST